jgi:hypothetical protein
MNDDFAASGIGKVTVATSSNGGMPPEYFAERIVEKLIFVGDNAPEPIKAQALAYREKMRAIVLNGLQQAIMSDRAYRKEP